MWCSCAKLQDLILLRWTTVSTSFSIHLQIGRAEGEKISLTPSLPPAVPVHVGGLAGYLFRSGNCQDFNFQVHCQGR